MPTTITFGAAAAKAYGFLRGSPPIIATNIGSATNSGSGSTCVITPSANIPVGATVFVFVEEYQTGANLSSAQTVVDSASNTYTCNTGLYSSPTNAVSTEIFSAKVTTQINSGGSITYNKFNAGNCIVMTAFYATGLATSGYDSATLATATSSSTWAGSKTSGTPSQSGELFLQVASGWMNPAGTYTLNAGWSGNPPPTFTTLLVSSTTIFIGAGYQIGSGVSTVTANPTVTNVGTSALIVAGYKHA